MKKTQITMEFLFLIGFVFVIAVGLITGAGFKMKEFSDKKQDQNTNDFIDSLKKELDLASVVKIGYKREIDLPDKIDGTIEYTVQMNGSAIFITTNQNDYIRIIPASIGTLAKGKNTIKKINSSIEIENG